MSLLAERLKQQRIDYTVANASVSGETTLGGLKRINATLTQHQPAIVLLALGEAHARVVDRKSVV